MRGTWIGLTALGCGLVLSACHPVSQDSAGSNPVPPADAPSDGASGAVSGSAPTDASGAPSSNVVVD